MASSTKPEWDPGNEEDCKHLIRQVFDREPTAGELVMLRICLHLERRKTIPRITELLSLSFRSRLSSKTVPQLPFHIREQITNGGILFSGHIVLSIAIAAHSVHSAPDRRARRQSEDRRLVAVRCSTA